MKMQNLIEQALYEIFCCVLALVKTAQLTEQSVALRGLDQVVRVQL
jgi:hypothetical protein